MATCAFGPDFDKLVEEFGFGKATMITDRMRNSLTGEIERYPSIEEAKEILEDILMTDKDELFVRETEAHKLQRLEEQLAMINDEINEVYAFTKNQLQIDTLKKMFEMTKALRGFYKSNLELIKENKPIKKTIAISSFIGSSEFKNDPLLYLDYKNFGIFVHHIVEEALKISKRTGDNVSDLINEQFVDALKEEFIKKNPFEIKNLTTPDMVKTTKYLLEEIPSLDLSGCIFLPEITIMGKSKNENNLIGRIDLMVIDPTGKIIVIDFKTKKVKNMLEYDAQGNPFMINDSAIFRSISATTYPIIISKKDGKPTGVGESFKNEKIFKRSAFDNWYLQLDCYENILIQNGMEVTKKMVPVLFYSQDEKHLAQKSYLFRDQDYYEQAFSSYIKKENIKQTKSDKPFVSYEEKMNVYWQKIKIIKDAVNKEIPIGKAQETKEKKDFINTFEILPEEIKAKRFIDSVESFVQNQFTNLRKEISNEYQKEVKNYRYIQILEARLDNLKSLLNIITKHKLTSPTDLKRATTFFAIMDSIDNEMGKLDKSIDLLLVENNTIEITDEKYQDKINNIKNEILRIMQFNKALRPLINEAYNIINDFKKDLAPDSDIRNKLFNLETISNKIDAAFRKISLKNSVQILMFSGEAVYKRVNEQMEKYILAKINKLQNDLDALMQGKGMSVLSSFKQRLFCYFDKDAKRQLEENMGPDGKLTLNAIETLQRQIEELNFQLEGVQFNEGYFEKYIDAIRDPYSLAYIGADTFNKDFLTKGIDGSDFIATVSNSDPSLSQFVMIYKNSERNAYRALQENELLRNVNTIKDKLLAKGWTLTKINKFISETREVSFIDDNDKENKKTYFALRVPYTEEYQNVWSDYNIKGKKLTQEVYKLKNQYFEADNKLKDLNKTDIDYETKSAEARSVVGEIEKQRDAKIRERENHWDTYTKWMQENSNLIFRPEFYELQMKLPADLREKIQVLYTEQESIMYGINKGFEAELSDEDLDRIYEIEIEIKKLKREYKEDHPEYVEALNKLNEYYEYDTNIKYFQRIEDNIKAQYKDDPEQIEKWKKLSYVKRIKKECYTELSKLYSERENFLPSLPESYIGEVEDLRRKKSILISSYKPYGEIGLETKFMSNEDIEELDAIDNRLDEIYKEVAKTKPFSGMAKEELQALADVNARISELVTTTLNEQYKETLYGDFEKLEALHTKVLQAEARFNDVSSNQESTEQQKKQAFEEYTFYLKLFKNKEEEYTIWYNKNHYNTFVGFESGNKKFLDFAEPKSFNKQRIPVDEKYIEEVPHPKFYGKKKLRKDIWIMDDRLLSSSEILALKALDKDVEKTIRENNITVKPNAYNPEYQKSFDGIPLPKSLKIDENGNIVIRPGMEGDKNINSRFLEMYNDSEILEFYNALSKLFFDLQKRKYGVDLGYAAPGFTDGIISNMLNYDNTWDAIASQLKNTYDKFLNVNNSRYDEIENIWGQNKDLRMRFSKQYPEGMQSKDLVNCIYKYAVEAHYNIELQKIAPAMNLHVEFMKYQRDLLAAEVQTEPIKTITVNGKTRQVDMSKRLKEFNKIISLLEYEQQKFQEGHADIQLNKGAKKIINALFAYSSFIRIGFDVANQAKNYLSGNVQAWLAAGNFESNHYSRNDYYWAKKIIYGTFLPNYFKDWGKFDNLSLTTLIYRDFDPMMKETMKYIDGVAGNRKLRLTEKAFSLRELGYILQDKGDTEIGLTVMFSILNHYKFKKIKHYDSNNNIVYEVDENGNHVFVSAFDCYFVNSKGLLEKRKDVHYTDADERMLRNIVISEMRRAQGNYAKQDQTFFEQKALGKMIFFFRKFLVPQLLNRFGYFRPSYESADVAYGYWRAVFAAVKYFGWGKAMGEFILGHKALKKFGIEGIEKIHKRDSKTGEIIGEVEVGDFWNSKLSHARRDMLVMLGFSILGYMALVRLKNKEDDDEELSIIEGNMIRVLWQVTGETVAMNPLFGGQKEYIRNFTQGIPFVREFQYFQKITSHMLALGYINTFTSGEEPDPTSDDIFYQRMYRDAYYAQKSGPYEEGDPKLIKDLVDMTGIRNLRDLFQPENRLDVLKKNQ